MKKFIYIILFSISILTFAQKPPNRFMEEESVNAVSKEETTSAKMTLDNPGNVGDPLPINDYIPFLIITAMGLIVFTKYRKPTL